MLKFVKACGKGIKLTRMFYQMFKRRVGGALFVEVLKKNCKLVNWGIPYMICFKKQKQSAFMSFPIMMNKMKHCQRHNGPEN